MANEVLRLAPIMSDPKGNQLKMQTMMRRAGTAVSTLALAMAAQPALATTLQEALAQAYRTNPTLNAARAQLRASD